MSLVKPLARSLVTPLPRSLIEGVGVWSPAQLDAYMASLADGLVFDFTKTDRHFQESVGPTLADDIGEAIGLALDQRTWGGKTLSELIASQPELVTNGAFTSDLAGWTDLNTGTGTSVWESPGRLRMVSADASNLGRRTQPFATVVGRTYRLSVAATIFATAGRILLGTSSGASDIVSQGISAATTVYYFVATSTTTYVTLLAGNGTSSGNAAYDDVSCKLIPGNYAVQPTGTLKGVRQATGDKFDGTDDRQTTPYFAGAGNNFIVALLTLPASVGVFQWIVHLSANDGSGRLGLGINTDGQVGFGIGATSPTVAKGGGDKLGQRVVVGVSCDGTTMRGFVDTAEVYTGAQSGSPDTATGLRLGASNPNAGSPANFYSGSIEKLLSGRDALTLATYLQIRNALLAA